MALDIGDVRTGIAISDPAGKVATPVCVLPSAEVSSNAASFKRVLEDWEPEMFLVGLPRTLAGEEGPQAAHIRKIAGSISEACGVPVQFFDERLSSVSAKAALRDLGYDEKHMRGKVDMVAASLFLQAWLDSGSAASAS